MITHKDKAIKPNTKTIRELPSGTFFYIYTGLRVPVEKIYLKLHNEYALISNYGMEVKDFSNTRTDSCAVEIPFSDIDIQFSI